MNLSFPQRLFLGMKALTGVLDLKPGSMGYQLLKGALPGAVGAPPARGTQAHLQSYSTMPWVRAVASRVGHAVSATTWKLYATTKNPPTEGLKAQYYAKKSIQFCTDRQLRKSQLTDMAEEGTLREITEHPLLDLLHEGNPIHSGMAIRKMSSIHRDLVGESFWLKDRGVLTNGRTGKQMLTSIWPVAPHWIMSTPTLTNQAYRVGFRGWQGWIPASEMIWFKDPDPAMPYWRGTGTSQALSDEMETDEYAAKYIKAFFYNHARPDVIITPKGENASLNPTEMDRLENQWNNEHQGFWRAFKPLFSNRAIDVTVLEANFRQLQMKDLRQHIRDICLQVWGVSPEILGVLENSNRATIDAADYLFSKWVVVPRLEDWRLDYQRLLVPEYDERLILDYENPVQDDKAFAKDVMTAMPEAFSLDEIRELVGQEALEDDLGKQHIERTNVKRVMNWEEPEPTPVGKVDPLTGLPYTQPAPPPGAEPTKPPVKWSDAELAKFTDEELLDMCVKLGKGEL